MPKKGETQTILTLRSLSHLIKEQKKYDKPDTVPLHEFYLNNKYLPFDSSNFSDALIFKISDNLKILLRPCRITTWTSVVFGHYCTHGSLMKRRARASVQLQASGIPIKITIRGTSPATV